MDAGQFESLYLTTGLHILLVDRLAWLEMIFADLAAAKNLQS